MKMNYKYRIQFIIIILCLQILPKSDFAQITPELPIGVPKSGLDYTPLQSDIGYSKGTYNSRIELEIPPGRNGLKPDISIFYSQDLTNGFLGHGWSLSFLSKIQRLSKFRGIAEFSSSDIFLVDGEELILMPDETYRTKRNSFTQFTKSQSQADLLSSFITGWSAKKNGTTYYYGSEGKTFLNNNPYNSVEYRDAGTLTQYKSVAWLLRRIEDVYGNYISINYTVPLNDDGTSTFNYLPQTIRYNSSEDNFCLIEFSYSDRDDDRVFYDNGQKRYETKLLTGIQASVVQNGDTSIAYIYQLDYITSVYDRQSLLKKILRIPVDHKTGEKGNGLTLYEFDYEGDTENDINTDWLEAKAVEVKQDPDYPEEEYETNPEVSIEVDDWDTHIHYLNTFSLLTDLNGDSRPDLIVFNDDVKSGIRELTEVPGAGLEEDSDRPTPTLLLPYFSSIPTHKVYLNKLQKVQIAPIGGNGKVTTMSVTPYFEYDYKRSLALTEFFGSMTRANGTRLKFEIIDLNRDGFPELLKGKVKCDNLVGSEEMLIGYGNENSLLAGTSYGWAGLEEQQTPEWMEIIDETREIEIFDKFHFVDLNSDGFTDMVGQTSAYINLAPETGLIYFDKSIEFYIDDPLIKQSTSDAFDTDYNNAGSNCLNSASEKFLLKYDLGQVESGSDMYYYPNNKVELEKMEITSDEYVWRNTIHTDVNSDGIMDRVITFRYPSFYESVTYDFANFDVWNYSVCAFHSEVYLGDGLGRFYSTGYGVGNPLEDPVSYGASYTEERGTNFTINYDYYRNTIAFADINGNGRLALLRSFNAYPHLGLSGYGTESTTGIVNDLRISHPVHSFGVEPLHMDYSTFVDLNGDGFDDGVYVEPPTKDDEIIETKISWYKNERKVNLNRLTKVINSYDGYVELSWGNSAQYSENNIPLNVDFIESVQDQTGNRFFEFTGASYGKTDGRFLGFEKVITYEAAGGKTVRTFHTHAFPVEGEPIDEVVYDEQGRVNSASYYRYYDIEQISSINWWIYPEDIPYYTPLEKICTYLFNRSSQPNSTITSNIESGQFEYDCKEFIDEPNVVEKMKDPQLTDKWNNFYSQAGIELNRFTRQTTHDTSETTSRSHRPLRGHERRNFSLQQDKEKKSLFIYDISENKSYSSDSVPNSELTQKDIKRISSLRNLFNKLSSGKEIRAKNFNWPFSGPLKIELSSSTNDKQSLNIVPMSLASVNTSEFDEIPSYPWQTELYRMYVTGYDYDFDHGLVTKEKDLKDISVVKDSKISENTYHEFDSDYFGALMESSQTKGRASLVEGTNDTRYELFKFSLADYVGDKWKKRTQWDRNNSVSRVQKRQINPDNGDILAEEDELNNRSEYDFNSFGLVIQQIDPIGNKIMFEYDDILRNIKESTSGGFEKISEYDDLHRLIKEETKDAVMLSSGVVTSPAIVRNFRYNWGATLDENIPAVVEILEETDDQLVLVKQFKDQYNRTVKTVKGLFTKSWDELPESDAVYNYPSSAFSCNSIADPYACDPNSAIVNETEYNNLGVVEKLIGPYYESEDRDEARVTKFKNFDFLKRSLTRTEADGGEYEYEYDLGIEKETDPLGILAKVYYNTYQKKKYAGGVFRESSQWDCYGLTKESVSGANDTTSFEYDGFNRKDKVIYPEVMISGSEVSSVNTFDYLVNDWLQLEKDANGNEKKYDYDNIGRITNIIGPTNYVDESNNYNDGTYPARGTEYVDDLGNSSFINIDAFDRPYKVIDTDGNQIFIEYDLRGREIKRKLSWGEIIESKYDLHDRLIKTISTRSTIVAESQMSYDVYGNIVQSTDPDGVITTFEYDDMDRITQKMIGSSNLISEKYEYDAAGRIVKSVIDGLVTRYELNDLGLMEKEHVAYDAGESPNELILIERSYNKNDLIESETIDGDITSYEYNALNWLIAQSVSGSDGTSYGKVSYEYDAVGNITREIDQSGNATDVEYDEYSRPVKIQQGPKTILGSTHIIYQRNGINPLTGASSKSWVTTSIGPEGETSITLTDSEERDWLTKAADNTILESIYEKGLPVLTRRYDQNGSLYAVKRMQYHPSSSLIQYSWNWMSESDDITCSADPDCNRAGKLTNIYTTAGRIDNYTDGDGNITNYDYLSDNSGLIDRIEYGGVKVISNKYHNDFPVLTSIQVDPDGTPLITEISYERFLRPSKINRTITGTSELEETRFEYNKKGQEIKTSIYKEVASSPECEMFFEYDAIGRQKSKQYNIRGTTYNPILWKYRDNGTLLSVKYPSGNEVSYRYIPNSNILNHIDLTSASVKTVVANFGEFDASGRPQIIDIAAFTSSKVEYKQTFDNSGRKIKRVFSGHSSTGSDRTEEYGYDDNGRLNLIDVKEGNGNAKAVYSFDIKDYLTTEEHISNGITFDKITYNYDIESGHRIGRVKEYGGSTTSDSYFYETGNRLKEMNSKSINWDKYGRQLNDYHSNTFQYGMDDQLVKINNADGTIEENIFDADRQRVARSINGSDLEIYLSGQSSGEVLEEIMPDGQIFDNIFTPSGNIIARIDASEVITPVVREITGSSSLISADDTHLLATGYEAFGFEMPDAGVVNQPGFHQTYNTSANGMKIAGVRVVDSETGGFTSPDPLASDPTSLYFSANVFSYALNDPVNLMDPTGYYWDNPQDDTDDQSKFGKPILWGKGNKKEKESTKKSESTEDESETNSKENTKGSVIVTIESGGEEVTDISISGKDIKVTRANGEVIDGEIIKKKKLSNGNIYVSINTDGDKEEENWLEVSKSTLKKSNTNSHNKKSESTWIPPTEPPLEGASFIGIAFGLVIAATDQLSHNAAMTIMEGFEWYAKNTLSGIMSSLIPEPLLDIPIARIGMSTAFKIGRSGTTLTKIASGEGGKSTPMKVETIIDQGTKIPEIINDIKQMTWKTGNEHAVVRLANGQKAIVSGGPGGIIFESGQIKTLFGHTHPTSAPPSSADFNAIRKLGQSRQYVFHGGERTLVRPR